MKETVFEFELDLISEDSDAALADLTGKLQEFKGIETVQSKRTVFGTTLSVTVKFAKSDDAVKLHKKIIRTLIRNEKIRVTRAITKLTDI